MKADKKNPDLGTAISAQNAEKISQSSVDEQRNASKAAAIGAVALGALAVGAFAIGGLVIGMIVISTAKIKQITIDELKVKHLIAEKLEFIDRDALGETGV